MWRGGWRQIDTRVMVLQAGRGVCVYLLGFVQSVLVFGVFFLSPSLPLLFGRFVVVFALVERETKGTSTERELLDD